MIVRTVSHSLLVFAVLGLAQIPAFAQEAQPPKPPETPIEVILRPAAEPVPALRYRLAPERRTQEPGNAAVF